MILDKEEVIMKEDLFMSKTNSNDDSVKIISWLVANKEYVVEGQPIATVETSKTNVDIESDSSGYILQHYQCGDMLTVGSCFASLYKSIEAMQDKALIHDLNMKSPTTSKHQEGKFSHSARKYIEENKLNPDDFTGLGLVTIEKIKATLTAKTEEVFDLDKIIFPQASVEKMSFSKLTEIAILGRGKEGLISSSLTIQFNTDEIRKSLIGLSWLNGRISTYILYIFSHMLNAYPKFTSYYHDKKIYYYNKVNLGVAIDFEKGLKVAVIKDANILSLFDLQMAIIDCIANYYEDSFTISSLCHSTITTTDLSNDGILYFQPVLNENQSVIMGIGGDQNLSGSPVTLTIVFDHRIHSGQEVAMFLKRLKDKLLTEHLKINYVDGKGLS